MIIYTPGHNIFMDSLIMYGIIGSISEYFKFKGISEDILKEVKIEYTGNEYLIDLENVPSEYSNVGMLADSIIYTVSQYKDSIIARLIDEVRLIQRQVRRGLESTMAILTRKELLVSYLEDLKELLHISRYQEGRHFRKRRKKQKALKTETVWLALLPFAGKFFLKEFKADIEEYKACPICKGLATLGLYFMGMVGYQRGTSLETVVTFDGEVSFSLLKHYKDVIDVNYATLFTKISKLIDVVPSSLIPKISFLSLAVLNTSLLREMDESNASWHAITVGFVKGATQLRTFNELSLDPLINALTTLPEDTLIKLENIIDVATRRIRDKGTKRKAKGIQVDPDTVDLLLRFLEYREGILLYKAVRMLYKDDVLRNMLSFDIFKDLSLLIA